MSASSEIKQFLVTIRVPTKCRALTRCMNVSFAAGHEQESNFSFSVSVSPVSINDTLICLCEVRFLFVTELNPI
jgi:hypothetical protein